METRAPLPSARDHVTAVSVNGVIHVIGGRVDSFHTNSNLHHVYDPQSDKWSKRNPLPTEYLVVWCTTFTNCLIRTKPSNLRRDHALLLRL